MIKKITNPAMLNSLLKDNNKVIAQFTAAWCGPCREIKPHLEDFSKQYTDVQIASIDIDEYPDLAEKYGIMSIPTFVAFVNEKETDTLIGANPKAVQQFIDKLIKG